MIERHFTATGIVFNHKDEILMIKHKKLHVWLPPGGHLEASEIPDKALLREVFEETGVEAIILTNKRELDLSNDVGCEELETPFVVLLEDIESNGKHLHIDLVYLCIADNETLTADENEVDDIGWFSHDEIMELTTYENVKRTITEAVIEKNAKQAM